MLEREELIAELRKRGEVIRRQDLSLQNGEVDLHLVEPAGVNRGVDHDDVRPALLKAIAAALPAMRGAVVHDPGDAWCGAVGPLVLGDEAVERSAAHLALTPTEDLAISDVPGSE